MRHFLLVAGATGGEISVSGLNTLSAQADRKILEALEAAGAGMSINKMKSQSEKAN